MSKLNIVVNIAAVHIYVDSAPAAQEFLGAFGFPADSALAGDPAPVATPDTPSDSPRTTGTKIDGDTFDELVDDGVAVDWKGAKFQFTGKVLQVVSYWDDTDSDDKIVYIRRDDTGKKVSLTKGDIEAYSLVVID